VKFSLKLLLAYLLDYPLKNMKIYFMPGSASASGPDGLRVKVENGAKIEHDA
jgi:hypothetical protein